MTRALLLLLSAALIAAGVLIVWRDVQRRRREAFLGRGDSTAAHPEVEVVVARSGAGLPLPRIPHSVAPNPLLSTAQDALDQPPASGQALEPTARWAALRPSLSVAA